MSIADQFPRRMSRAVLAAVVPPGSTAEDGTRREPGAAPGSWPWRRAALLASIAAQLITISALESADPVPASWPALLLAVVLVTGIIGQAIQTGLFYLFFLPALATMIVAALRLRREGSLTMARQIDRDQAAVLAGLAAPLALAAALIPFRASFPNTGAALALVLVVVAVAAAGRRLAGIAAAVSAAVWFDFFLTVPYERFTITRRADIETTVLILAVGIAVTEIAVRRRRQHAAAARRAGYLDGISAAARAVATGTEPQLLIGQVCDQLTRLLELSACRFQDGAAGIGNPPRLLRDGRVVTAGHAWDTGHEGLPPGRDTELLAEAGGLLQGRFLLTPGPGSRPGLEQRLVAVGLADQAAAALAGARLAPRP